MFLGVMQRLNGFDFGLGQDRQNEQLG